jgi:energy-converting hydrogenase B subunit D
MVPLQVVALVLSALAATAVVLVRDTLRQVVVNSFYGLVLTAVFLVFQAPDVALSMLVVGTIGYPVIVLVSILRCRRREEEDE